MKENAECLSLVDFKHIHEDSIYRIAHKLDPMRWRCLVRNFHIEGKESRNVRSPIKFKSRVVFTLCAWYLNFEIYEVVSMRLYG